MQSFGADEEDRDDAGSPNGSSDNDADEHMDDMDDIDAEAEPDPDPDGEGEGENDDDEDDNDDDDDEQNGEEPQDPFLDSPARGSNRPVVASRRDREFTSSRSSTSFGGQGQSGPTSHPNPTVLFTATSPTRSSSTANATAINLPSVRPEALTAPVYDIVPTIAAPHSTSINAITATPDLRWVFSGGADGYIRKFNWVETANGKVMLTVAQRHPFVDSVTKAGVLMSYWENEEPQSKGDDGPSLSSVYSLAVQNEGLWLLSGLESGGINLQSVRHDEGKRIACLQKHTSAVSVLNLSKDEKSILSGSWDRRVLDWDLNTGQVKRSFEGSGGQISALEMRPFSTLPVPEASGDSIMTNGTFSTDIVDKPRANGALTNGVDHETAAENGAVDAPASPADSLFGGNGADSLFGDDEGEAAAPSGGNFADDDDDEFSRAIANGIQQQENEDAEGDVDMIGDGEAKAPMMTNGVIGDQANISNPAPLDDQTVPTKQPETLVLTNGLPHADETERHPVSEEVAGPAASDPVSITDSTFLAASFDGTLRVWDKRKPAPVAKISPKNVPPWCMNACWSPDGNFIYAGRRNGTVEEFSLHKGLRGVERTFKFPNGSGAVSAVRAMPNGRHLICASYDILRLYDLQQQQSFKHSTVPFLIVPGHRTGVVSQLYIDPTCRYMISTAGNRGWEGNSTEVLLGYEVGIGT